MSLLSINGWELLRASIDPQSQGQFIHLEIQARRNRRDGSIALVQDHNGVNACWNCGKLSQAASRKPCQLSRKTLSHRLQVSVPKLVLQRWLMWLSVKMGAIVGLNQGLQI